MELSKDLLILAKTFKKFKLTIYIMQKKIIKVNPSDNVAVALVNLVAD
jgi:hypothetical protein